jgi:hypothetical protein
VADYVAGMTDRFALAGTFARLLGSDIGALYALHRLGPGLSAGNAARAIAAIA